jgi:cell envelope opacity-associated protein A
MNRRARKRETETVDYFEIAKKKLASIDVKEIQKIKSAVLQEWHALPRLHQKLLTAIVPVVLILMIIPLPDSQPIDPDVETSAVPQRVELSLNAKGLSQQSSSTSAAAPVPKTLRTSAWTEYVIKDGDTLSQVFRNNDLSVADLNALVKIEGIDRPLSHITKGQLIRYKLNAKGELDILQLERGGESVMFFRLSTGGFARSQ